VNEAPAETRRGGPRALYQRLVARAVAWRAPVTAVYLLASTALAFGVAGRLGTEIFPSLEADQVRMRLRAADGTRVEQTEALALKVLELVKQEVGPEHVALTLGFVGVHAPSYPINLIYEWNGGPHEGVLQVQLDRGAPFKGEELKERLRARFARDLKEARVSFEPSDIVSRVMSFGSATPVEVAVSGPSLGADREFAEKIRTALLAIPELRDVQIGQALDYPTVEVAIDRQRAGLLGVKAGDVARSLVAATSSSRFTQPVYWADPNSGVAYQIQVEVPPQQMTSVEDVRNTPVAQRGGEPVLLRNVASVERGTAVGQYERYNMQRQVTVTANLHAIDLGHATTLVRDAIKAAGDPPPRVSATLRGQVPPLLDLMDGLRGGLVLSVALVLLLLTAYFQSLRQALVVASAAPAAIAGVALALLVTGTTLNIQSFMGAVTSIGVAVANAILLVTFAERSRLGGRTPAEAAVDGACGRLRPILMTSLAMMAGMLPMALGLGEGGAETAPLGRAVIGGLAAATVATLLVLPSVFALASARASLRSSSLDPEDPESIHHALSAD
jgi:multidrug efflux pump subunit AcrB